MPTNAPTLEEMAEALRSLICVACAHRIGWAGTIGDPVIGCDCCFYARTLLARYDASKKEKEDVR